jgi:hypothetical protein
MTMLISLTCLQCLVFPLVLIFADLKPYLGEDEELPSRTTSVQEGEDDEDTTSTSTPIALSPTPAPAAPSSAPPSGPITRARAREFHFVMMLKNEGPKD